MPRDLDARLPAALDYAVRDPKVSDLARLEIMLRLDDDLQATGAGETRWRTALRAKILGGITRLKRELEATAG